MRFGILGPFEVADDQGREVALGGPKQRSVLAILLLHAGEVVSSERLIDELWGERPPTTAAKTVQVYVSHLRKALDAGRLVTRSGGYVFVSEPAEVDVVRFHALVAEGRAALSVGDPRYAADSLGEALALWRGPPLADFVYEPFAQSEVARLEESRLGAREDLIEAQLELGQHTALVGELEALVRANPLRERLQGQLMLALYRVGRQADALAVYRDTSERLRDELGLEPGHALRELERMVLCHDPALAGPPAVVQDARPSLGVESGLREGRRTVTVVFCDLVGSTGLSPRLDPEALQRLTSRYFAELRTVLQRHSGTVQRYLGDAIVAIFGVPIVHEDDALRAVRAAAAMRDALPALNRELERTWGVALASRIGVNTGEAVAGDSSDGELLSTGAAVNVARYLAEAAEADEILISPATYRLVRGAVRAEPVQRRDSRRAGVIDAVRLLEVVPGASGRARRFDSPLVGRVRPLEALTSVFRNAAVDRVCHLYTVLGSAGVGKSRLVREFLERVGGGVTVLTGRCLAYGEGITYWPLADALRAPPAVSDRSSAELSVEVIVEQLAGEAKAQLIAERVAAVLGVGAPVAGAPEETFWAVRKLFEALARARPLVVVFDDLQWAEPTFLDLVEHIADYSRGCPIFILCVARPELLDTRPGWPGGKLNATSVLLEPLSDDECVQLIANLHGPIPLPAKSAVRIAQAAEGNPLFAEELLAMLVDEARVGGSGRRGASDDLFHLTLPPTLQALLAARLELLPDDERALVEWASVEGTQFHRGAVAELASGSSELTLDRTLMALVRRDLIRPDRSTFAAEQAFRFRHVLIRDAAYESLRKETRAELHQRFAVWLERAAGPRLPEFEGIVGYHLELAYRYRRLLRTADADAQALARRASRRLESAGRRALRRNDLPAAIGLLERAAKFPVDDDPLRATLLVDLAATMIEAGKLTKAKPVLVKAARLATAGHDARVCAHVDVQRHLLELEEIPGQGTTEAKGIVERVLPVFQRACDHLGLCRALRLRAYLYWIEARAGAAAQAWEEAAEHARLAGAERERVEILTWVASSLFFGPTPANEAIVGCERIRAEVGADAAAEAATLHPLAGLHALGGRFTLARELLATSRAVLADIDPTLNSAVSHPRAIVEMLAGDPSAAEASLKADSETLDAMKDEALLATTDAFRAQALLAQGRDDEAEHYTRLSEQRAATTDLLTQVIWRSTRARILAKRGRIEEAKTLAHHAVSLAKQTDFLNHQADALVDLAYILHRAERREESHASAGEALLLYEQKGNAVAAASTRSLLAQLTNDNTAGGDRAAHTPTQSISPPTAARPA